MQRQTNKFKIWDEDKLKYNGYLFGYRPFRKVVCATGCIDILTCGHISYLQYAASLGDWLIVGLDDDNSIRNLKGPTRPINHQDCRAHSVAALECVDFVVIYKNTKDFLNLVKPDIWCKGPDYTLETLNIQEKNTVLNSGGQIVFAPRIYNISTTQILERLNGK